MSELLAAAVGVTVGAPLFLLVCLGVGGLGDWLGERGVGALTGAALFTALVGAVTALVVFHVSGGRPQVLEVGDWFTATSSSFGVGLALDSLSLGFTALSLLICNVVAAFSFRYLHQEPGYRRYFFQMAMFVVGITLVSLAGTVEVLFVGWELLGLSSALLVGFFQERRAPASNALRVFAIYRLSDAAMLSAAVLTHAWTGSGSLSALWSSDPAQGVLESGQVHVIGVLLIVAVACKSALWPFSGWLPRAMEGPTPSSAVYYGALSIHAGCFLLLRAQPMLAESEFMTALMIVGGAITSLYASLTGRVQTDVKSAIAYATLTQVGIIVVEIALGLQTLPMLHIAGHACFRLLQFLSAPNVLHDLHEMEKRLGGSRRAGRNARATTRQTSTYLLALERGFADSLLDRVVTRPFVYVASMLDALDRLLVGDRTRRQGRTS